MLWANKLTGELHFQGKTIHPTAIITIVDSRRFIVHPCGVCEIIVDPLPEGKDKTGALYPDGAHLTDLKQVRELLYKLQRPAIAPKYVYPHDWKEGDLVLFHNRGVLHSVVGAFTEDQVRAFWQCNLGMSPPFKVHFTSEIVFFSLVRATNWPSC